MQSFTTRWTLVFLFLPLILFSQEKLEPYTPDKYNTDAHSFIEADDYKSAEREFARIHYNDTLYNQVLLNRAICFRKIGQPEKALTVIEEGLQLNKDYLPELYLNKAMCLDSLEKNQEAMDVLDEALNRFPYNYTIKATKGDVYESMGEFSKAIDIYKTCIKDEPLVSQHHIKLASVLVQAKGMTHAALPITAALALSPESSVNLTLLNAINEILTSKSDIKEPIFDISTLDDDFEDIDDLIGNYIALSDKYKVPGEFQFGYIKQLYLIITESEDDGDGFFSTTYLQPLKAIVGKEMFPEFAALLCYVSQNEDHQKYIKKNFEKLQNVSLLYRDMLDDIGDDRSAPNGEFDFNVTYFYDDGKLDGFCQYDEAKDILMGKGIFTNSLGSIDRNVEFDNKGNATGEWTWYYPNGETMRTSTFENGMLQGNTKFFTELGNPTSSMNFVDGELDGNVEYYKLIGYKYEDKPYKKGLEHGEIVGYFPNQSVKYKMQYKEGLQDGDFIYYYEDGSVSAKGSAKLGKYHGMVESYYRDGTINYSQEYKDGKLNGKYLSNFEDGSIHKEGFYKNDKEIGTWKQYNLDGKLTQIEEYDEKGKVSGLTKNLDHKGRIETEYNKKKGNIIELTNYDANGVKISSYKKKGDKLVFKNLNTKGYFITEGQFINDARGREWKYYDEYEKLSSSEFYKDGLLDGIKTDYYGNSQIYSTTTYKEGIKEGLYVYYFPNGNINTQGYYKADLLDGRLVKYNLNGTIISDEYYMEGVLVGDNKYYNADGSIYLIETYDRGYLINGKRFSPDGEVRSTFSLERGAGIDEYYFDGNANKMGSVTYQGGEKNGPSLRYHINGELRSKSNYINDQIHGESIRYHHNGHILLKREFEYDQLKGGVEWYDYDGNLEFTYNYKYGFLDGEYIKYHTDGSKYSVYNYRNGKLEGPATIYDESGETKIIHYYENGVLIGYSFLDENKIEKEMILIEKGTSDILAYYPNGNKSVEYSLKSGMIDGKYKQYFLDGSVSKESNWVMNIKEGKETSYHENGNPKVELNYITDELNGLQTYFYDNGNTKRTMNYLVGEIHGLTTEFTQDGQKRFITYIGDVPYEIK